MNAPRRSIVVGLDRPDSAGTVLETAIAYARSLAADLHVVHSTELLGELPGVVAAAGWSEGSHADGRRPRARVRRRIYARLLDRSLDPQTLRVHVSPDRPDRLLEQVAREHAASLIVVGAGRHAGPHRHIVGSTAERLLARAEAPVLVVRSGRSKAPERVLCATDLSECAAVAIRRGLDLLRWLRPTGFPAVRQVVVLTTDAPPLHREALAAAAYEEMLRSGESIGLPGTSEITIRSGHPAKEIVAEAAEWDADLIVVGTRGADAVPTGLGSVAGGTVRTALTDVLIVPRVRPLSYRGHGETPDRKTARTPDTVGVYEGVS